MPNWDEIRREWETTKITLKALAEKHGVKLGTLKSRKSREKWSRDKYNEVATIQKDATQTDDKVATPKKKPRYRSGSRRGAGNPNPKNQFTERNSAALKHGLFSRYIPKETLEIMGMLDKNDPADLIWDQIMIQYAAIIRAQSIMFVESKDEMIKELKKEKQGSSDSGSSWEEEWEFQFAWDRHATFLNAQSKAMSELRSLIKQFLDMAHEEDERRLKLEHMKLSVEKGKLEVGFMRGDTEEDAHEQVNSYVDALNAQVDDVFADEVDIDEEA